MEFPTRFRAIATAATAALLVQGAFSQDECTTAVPVTDGMTAFDTTLANDEGLPVACGFGAAFDIWYAYTPAAAGPLTVSTCNAASFDTRLEVYESCGGTLLGCNDDGPGCSGFTSELTVNIAAGADVYIRVMGYNGATGTGTLTVDGPVFPDECADAALVTPDLPFAFDTTNATETGFDFSCNPFGGDLRSRDIWLTFTATADYMASASTCNTASYDTKIEIYDGTCGVLNSIICEEDTAGCAGFTTTANFMAVNGTQYFIRIGGWQTGEFGPGEILVTGPPPLVVNDHCVDAIALSDGVPEMFDTTLATPSVAAPAPSCGGSTPPVDIWYTVTPLATGVISIDTCASAFDTRLAVYVGGCGSLVEIACNDDDCSLQSGLSFAGTVGVTYMVRVAGYNADVGMGAVVATFSSMLPNDECAGALSVGLGTTPFANLTATDSGVVMPCSTTGGDNDVWFSYMAGMTGAVSIDLSGSDFDTVMEVFDGNDCNSLVSIACDDDGGTGLDSYVNFPATAGMTYLFHIGGFGTAEGVGIMTITEGLGSIVCLGDLNSTGVGADLTITGSDVVADNNLILTVTNLPANAMGYFVHSMETNTVLNPGGSEGTLCIASFTMGRFNANVLNSGAGGTVTFTPDLTALPTAMGPIAAAPGETRFFQYWTRDMSVTGAATSNFSGATGVVLQ